MRILLCDRLLSTGPAAGTVVANMQNFLESIGHKTEQILLPYVDKVALAPQQLMAFRLMTFAHTADCMIVFGAPLHVLRHPKKYIWCCNEPGSMLADAGGRTAEWLATSSRNGFGEAIAVHASTPSRQHQLKSLGIDASHLPLPDADDAITSMSHVVDQLLPQRALDAAVAP